jgi:hypothetical protein
MDCARRERGGGIGGGSGRAGGVGGGVGGSASGHGMRAATAASSSPRYRSRQTPATSAARESFVIVVESTHAMTGAMEDKVFSGCHPAFSI